MKCKIKDGFMLRQIAGTWVAVPTGSRAAETSVLITLSDSAVFLWHLCADGYQMDEMIRKITDDYEIDEQTAKRDVLNFVEYLKKNDLLED